MPLRTHNPFAPAERGEGHGERATWHQQSPRPRRAGERARVKGVERRFRSIRQGAGLLRRAGRHSRSHGSRELLRRDVSLLAGIVADEIAAARSTIINGRGIGFLACSPIGEIRNPSQSPWRSVPSLILRVEKAVPRNARISRGRHQAMTAIPGKRPRHAPHGTGSGTAPQPPHIRQRQHRRSPIPPADHPSRTTGAAPKCLVVQLAGSQSALSYNSSAPDSPNRTTAWPQNPPIVQRPRLTPPPWPARRPTQPPGAASRTSGPRPHRR